MPYKTLRQQTLHYLARPHAGLPPGPVDDPAAWSGAELREQGGWQEQLDAAEQDECDQAVQQALATGKPLEALTAADFPLRTLTVRIKHWRQTLQSGRGFVLLRGVPVQRWTTAQAECFFWGFGLHLGEPGAQNPRGDLLGHVRDERRGGDVRFYETNRDIAFHCDAADVVGLLCLRAAKSGGASRIASSVTVFNRLREQHPELVPRLFQPFHLDTHGEGGVRSFPVPPSRFAAGRLRTFWHSDYFRSAEQLPHRPAFTDQEQALLDAWDRIAADPAVHLDMDLQPGDVQLLSNHTQVHARTAYEDHEEPDQRRHLLRLWTSLPVAEPLGLRAARLRERLRLIAGVLRARRAG